MPALAGYSVDAIWMIFKQATSNLWHRLGEKKKKKQVSKSKKRKINKHQVLVKESLSILG